MNMDDKEAIVIDSEIMEYLIQDIYHCERLFILELENNEILSSNFIEKLKESNISTEINLITNEELFSKSSDKDCILAISLTGENPTTNTIVKTAKSKDSYIYSICSNSFSELASLSDDIIEINETDFKQQVLECLENIYEEIILFQSELTSYHYSKKISRSSNSQPLNILKPYHDKWFEIINSQSHTHFNQEAKKAKIKLILSILIPFILVFASIIYWFLYYYHLI